MILFFLPQCLEHLDLDNNALENFPEQLTTCTVLPSIHFYSWASCQLCTAIADDPFGWFSFFSPLFQQELRVLRVAENNIRVITAGLTSITSLREFHAGSNQIFTVLGDCSSLTNLEVSIPMFFFLFDATGWCKCLPSFELCAKERHDTKN